MRGGTVRLTYLDNGLGADGDHLVEIDVEYDVTDGTVVGVGHLHGVLYCPGQGPGVYHTRP